MRRTTGGFTIIELMIVITLLGVVTAIALPSFRYLTSSTKVKSASTELYLGLIRARNEAVKRNRLVSLTRHADGWQAGWRITADVDNDGSFTGTADRMVHETGAFTRVTITGAADSVVFLSSGRISSGLPEFTVTSEEIATMQRCISADLTGRPYTKEGAC
jgi:type IV fimbrial biogenesis protein FimT